MNPENDGAIIDFKGTKVGKVIIDGTKVKEIRGAENITEIEFMNGANAEQIQIYNTKGDPIWIPLYSNKQGTLSEKDIPNQQVKAGETLLVDLSEYFFPGRN